MRAIAVFLLVLGNLHTLCQGWTCTEGPTLNNALQIDAGLGQVVAVDTSRRSYILSGSSWQRLPSVSMKHISVGQSGIWATHVSDYIYKYVDGNWARVPGGLMQVDAGGNGFAAGVNRGNTPYCLTPAYTIPFNGRAPTNKAAWTGLGGGLKYISCGPYGCWGVSSGRNVYFKQLSSAASCSFTSYRHIGGHYLNMIEVGSDGKAFGVTSSGGVIERTGISSGRPYGSGWRKVTGLCVKMRQVSYDLGTIYGVSTAGVVMKCK